MWQRASRKKGSQRSTFWGFAPYVPVHERAASAARQVAALEKKGEKLSPVVLTGRTIATTFWGKAWCQNLESYSDYANRLPRGRTYVRSRCVIDLKIEPGKVLARVQGSSLYTVTIGVGPVEASRWKGVVAACNGKIDSVMELLQGRISQAVMEVISNKETGLFPSPRQIRLGCSCPDAASMCKHIAAALYGVGARLDAEPDLLFRLRGVDPTELSATAVKHAAGAARAPARGKRLDADIASVFGIDLDLGTTSAAEAPVQVAMPLVDRRRRPKADTTPMVRRAEKAKPDALGAGKKKPAADPKPATKAKRAAAQTVTAAALRLRGVPPATVGYWLKTGVLLRTPTAGVYEETDRSRERLARYGAPETA